MSETEHTQDTEQAPESATGGAGSRSEGPGEGEPTTSREAAKYRRKLRDAEGERDQLATTVNQMRRAEVERLAAGKLGKPSALWQTDVQVADMLTEDGQIDPDAVSTACDKAVTDYGLAEPPASVGAYVPDAGKMPEHPIDGSGFADAFRPR